jgi:putative restriction endonuclease
MIGWLAPTDHDWYSFLHQQGQSDEVNFWRPSARNRFLGDEFVPFLFKLKAPHNAICGFGFFARYAALPAWLAWDTFGVANGCTDRRSMEDRIRRIRQRMRFKGNAERDPIGCILIVKPVFFPPEAWIPQPTDWPPRNQAPMKYDLEKGEGARIWSACVERAQWPTGDHELETVSTAHENQPLFGAPQLVTPRLGQGTFRIAVMDAYGRACAATGEHSLPALDAAHIKPYAEAGPHSTRNGLLLRADFHRLFDQGYLTVTPDLRMVVSALLREEYENGKSYYPFHGQALREAEGAGDRPDPAFLTWHNDHVFRE